MEDLFSIFISLVKNSSENLSLADGFEAIQLFSAENGVSIRNQRPDRGNRIGFDLLTEQKASAKECDLQCLATESQSIMLFGGNEWELRKAGLFDEKKIDCFISRLALFLFLRGEYQVGLVSTEDTLASLSFKEFYPGYWTIFRNDMLPQFISELPFESMCEGVRVYLHDPFAKIGLTPEQMGRDIRALLSQNPEKSSGNQDRILGYN